MKIDNREPPEVINKIKKHFTDIDIEVKQLDCGDIWLDDGKIIIERKSTNDLLASVADGRIFNQASEMRRQCENCYFLVEGPLIWLDQKIIGTEWHFRAIQGALLKGQELGCCVVYYDGASDIPKAIEWLKNHDRSKIAHLPPRKFGLPALPSQIALIAFDGIGLKKADDLLAQCGSLAAVLECLSDDFCPSPKGIGPKIRETIRQVLGLSVGEKFTIERVANE